MSYTAQYINELIQFGTVSLDLILIDDENIMPDRRIGKNFRIENQITEEALEIEALREINQAIEEYNAIPV